MLLYFYDGTDWMWVLPEGLSSHPTGDRSGVCCVIFILLVLVATPLSITYMVSLWIEVLSSASDNTKWSSQENFIHSDEDKTVCQETTMMPEH